MTNTINASYTESTIKAMKEWLQDCVWADMEPEDFDDLSNDQIVIGVKRFFDGGIDGFLLSM